MVIHGNIYKIRRLLNNKPHSLTMKLLIGLDKFNLNARAELSKKLHSKLSNTHTHTHKQHSSEEKIPTRHVFIGIYLSLMVWT